MYCTIPTPPDSAPPWPALAVASMPTAPPFHSPNLRRSSAPLLNQNSACSPVERPQIAGGVPLGITSTSTFYLLPRGAIWEKIWASVRYSTGLGTVLGSWGLTRGAGAEPSQRRDGAGGSLIFVLGFSDRELGLILSGTAGASVKTRDCRVPPS
jgi:hypothetical protein